MSSPCALSFFFVPSRTMAEAGLAIGVANTVGNIPNHARTLNATYHDVVEFRERIAEARSEMDARTAEFEEWKEIWKYDSPKRNLYAPLHLGPPDNRAPAEQQGPADNQTPAGNQHPEIYQFLWSDQYSRIYDAVILVEGSMTRINEHIERIVNEKKNTPAWRHYLNVPRARYIRNLTYALFSNSALQAEIARLRGSINRLKDISETRLRVMQGNDADLKLTGTDAFQLANLEYFGRKIAQELRDALPAESAWSLELCHPDIGGSATKWQGLTSVQLWLSYSIPVVGQHDTARQRIILEYSLVDDPNPPPWASALPGGANSARNPPGNPHRGLVHNPRLTENWHGTGNLTVPFSNLFRTWHGNGDFQAELWARDQAYLVLSLANWSLLLWTSDWTARWCSSGLHFVRARTSVETAGRRSFFFPSFSGCAFQRPGIAIPHDHHDCRHSDLKLCNLGLVLAEAICVIPLRATATQYRYDKCVNGEWMPLYEDALLDLVDEKTGRSKGVRDAVQICLRSTDTLQTTKDKLAGFLKKHVKTVFDP